MLADVAALEQPDECLGGTLHQDLPRTPGALQHISSATGSVPWHGVRIEADSLLTSVVGATELRVNSYHHQAIDVLGPGLVVTGSAADGVIEAVEHESVDAIGVQWHPEDTAATDPAQQALFDGFVRAASCVAQPNQVCARRFSPSTSR